MPKYRFNPFTSKLDQVDVSDVTIGGQVIDGTAGSVLFIDASGNLAQDTDLTFNGTTLTAGGFTTTGLGTLGSLVVDTSTLVANVAGYTDRVGIGTATPATSLHLAGTTSAHYAQIDTGMNFDLVTKATALTATLVEDATGNVTAGNHKYMVTFVTALGETETGTGSNTITADATHTKVNLTSIPVSSDYRVTSRNIYRTIATSPTYHYKLLTTIANNTETTYQDNTADGSLTGGATYPGYYYTPNNTNKLLLVDGSVSAVINTLNTAFGYQAGVAMVSPANLNSIFGANAGDSITTGTSNNLFGSLAGAGIITGTNNSVFGDVADYNGTGSYNTVIGSYSGFGLTTGGYNTYLGYRAGFTNSTGTSNVFLGTYAGYYETGSNTLFIDNASRTNEAIARVSALIYGGFSATVASQQLTINAGTLNFNAGTDADLVINLKGTTNSGVLTWMEDEDYFLFADDIQLPDSESLKLGTASDASIYYDGTNMIINPKEVGTGILDVSGVLQTDGYNSSDGTAGATGTITLAAITTITVKNGLITAYA